MAPIGSKLCQNVFQVIPDVSFFDARKRKKNKQFANFDAPFTPRMAPIDLKLGQNAFQVIPELSFFDVEDRKNFGFFGHDHCVLARTHVSWPKTHVSWPKTHVSWPKTHVSWPKQNDCDRKIRKIFGLRRQKVKVRGSPETDFGQVSGQSEPSSGGKRTFKVRIFFGFWRRKMKRRESPETRFGKVSSQSEPSSGGKRPFEV